MKRTVYLSLGSNLGDRAANLRAAHDRLVELGTVLSTSSVYETEPVEVERSQPWFLNCVVAVETELMPHQFHARSLAIERALGRRRREKEKRAPRVIDIDIVLFGNLIVKSRGLKIPHPGLEHRRFVLEPLAEIAPEGFRHPVLKQTIRELMAALPPGIGSVRKLEQEGLR